MYRYFKGLGSFHSSKKSWRWEATVNGSSHRRGVSAEYDILLLLDGGMRGFTYKVVKLRAKRDRNVKD